MHFEFAYELVGVGNTSLARERIRDSWWESLGR